MKTFVISLAGDINLYFSQNIQTNNFLLFSLMVLCVCVCVYIFAHFSYLVYAIVLSFVAGFSFNVMFFRFAWAQLFISYDKCEPPSQTKHQKLNKRQTIKINAFAQVNFFPRKDCCSLCWNSFLGEHGEATRKNKMKHINLLFKQRNFFDASTRIFFVRHSSETCTSFEYTHRQYVLSTDGFAKAKAKAVIWINFMCLEFDNQKKLNLYYGMECVCVLAVCISLHQSNEIISSIYTIPWIWRTISSKANAIQLTQTMRKQHDT